MWFFWKLNLGSLPELGGTALVSEPEGSAAGVSTCGGNCALEGLESDDLTHGRGRTDAA